MQVDIKVPVLRRIAEGVKGHGKGKFTKRHAERFFGMRFPIGRDSQTYLWATGRGIELGDCRTLLKIHRGVPEDTRGQLQDPNRRHLRTHRDGTQTNALLRQDRVDKSTHVITSTLMLSLSQQSYCNLDDKMGTIYGLNHMVFKYAIRCAFSMSDPNPGKAILLPGMYFPGFFKNIQICSPLQQILAFFIGLLQVNMVDPAFLPMIPPSGGAPAPLPSPYISQQKPQFHGNRHSFRRRQTCLSSHLLQECPPQAE